MDTITPEMRVHGVTPWQKPWGNEMRAIGEARALAVCRRGGWLTSRRGSMSRRASSPIVARWNYRS